VHPVTHKEVMETQVVGHAREVGHGDVAEMACAMDAVRQCEIVSHNTQALDADRDKIHNPWENTQSHQVKCRREGQ